MYVLVLWMGQLPLNAVAKILLQILTGVVIYVVLALLTKNQAMRYALNLIKERRKAN